MLRNLVFLLLAGLVLGSPHLSGYEQARVRFFLETNKETYYEGEPIIAQVELANLTDAVSVIPIPGEVHNLSPFQNLVLQIMPPGGRFNIWSRDFPSPEGLHQNFWFFKNELLPAVRMAVPYLLSTRPPTAAERSGYGDFESSGMILSKERLTGKLLLVVVIPDQCGPFLARDFWSEKTKPLLTTNIITVEVVPLPEDEPILKVLTREQVNEFSAWIVGAHYGRGFDLRSLKIWKVVRDLLSLERESAFTETALYAYIVAGTRGGQEPSYAFETIKAQLKKEEPPPPPLTLLEAAEEFLSRYPKSMLKPIVYACLARGHHFRARMSLAEEERREHLRKMREAIEAGLKLPGHSPYYENTGLLQLLESESTAQ